MEHSLPPGVVRVRYSLGEDWSGDPAIFFRVLLSDDASRREDLGQFTSDIRNFIADHLRLADLDHFPYFDFRSESEQEQLKDPDWD